MEKSRPIKFRIEDQIVQASQDQTALESLLAVDFPIDHSCGGHGTCGTCRVFVAEGLSRLDSRNEIEAEMAFERGFQDDERLCCQMTPVEGLVLQLPQRGLTKKGFE